MELYHLINRGVDGRNIFIGSQDYARFVHDLYEFNDTAPAPEFSRRHNVGPTRSHVREQIVEIHGWCLMKNHYHLLLSELIDGGISRFLMKLNVGYVKYFNERYHRQGTLFQGRTKKFLIEQEAHFLYVLHYVHLNPLDYLPGATMWRERDRASIGSAQKALSYLGTYRWSSYLDYCGKKNFPSILHTDLFKGALGNYREAIKEYLAGTEEPLTDLTLE